MKRTFLLTASVIAFASAAYAQGTSISNLPSATTPLTGNELSVIVQNGQTVKTTVANIASGSAGTVTSITAGTGLLGGTITHSGTLSVNTGIIGALGNSNTWGGTQTFTNAIVAPAFTSGAAGLAPASGGGTTNFLRADGAWAVPSGGTGSFTGVTITPTSGTLNQGLVITQTSPTTGSTAGPLFYNEITTNSQANVTGGNQVAAALGVNFNVGGANLGGQPMAAGYFNTQTQFSGFTSNADKIGLIGGAQANINDASGSGYYGMNPVVSVTTGVSINRAVGFESDVIMNTGATANYRYAGALVNAGGGSGTGSTIDTALLIANIGGTAGAFKNGIDLSTNLGFVPIASTGSLVFADTSMALANILNMSNVTVSGNILSFPNVTLAGAGTMTTAGAYVSNNNPGATLGAGSGQLFGTTNGGANIQGKGANFDIALENSSGQNVCANPTTTRVLNCNTMSLTNALQLNGSTSGVLSLAAPATAGTNTITFPAGTTDFSSTGGTSQVVQQATSGGALTVGQLATTNLSDVTAPTSWTPGDASGASLTFTAVSATYTKAGKSISALVSFSFPATASVATAAINGLPIGPPSSSVQNVVGACWSSAGSTFGLMTAQIFSNSTSFSFFGNTGAAVTNVSLTAATVRCALNYVTN